MEITFLTVSVILIAFSVFYFVDASDFSKTAEKVRGEVVAVEEEIDSDGHRDTDVYVSFEYDSEIYEYVKLNDSRSNSRYEGERLTLYVDSEDLSDVRTTKAPVAGIALLCMGVMVMAISLSTFIAIFKKNNVDKTLMEKGKVIMAMVEQITYDPSVTVNGRNPLRVHCSYFDMYTAQQYNFTSESVWDNLNYNFAPGDQIPVYVMPDDYSKYYVSLESQNGKTRVVDFTRE